MPEQVPVRAGAGSRQGRPTAGLVVLDDENTYGHVKETGPGAGLAEGVTPAWMSGHLGLALPVTAKSPQAAYEGTLRFDTGLLTFTLTHSGAEAYLSENPSRGTWLEPPSAPADVPAHDFTHLGLPEPETFTKGVRYGYVCPGVTNSTESTESAGPSGAPDMPYGMEGGYDTSDERCVHLYAHTYSPHRTRIYLRAHFEPGISPLPKAPPKTGD
ncbi:hypothetical protein [Streptomyces californicus]|uniref:hypothetical protein n=1 Tax=Streptomyces californicus TaxID=67351 RepID=UPI0037A4B98E